MKVILISEDNHGQIGVALNYYNAVEWLIDNNWITYCTEVFDEIEGKWIPLIDRLGDNWASEMLYEWDIDKFNTFWNCYFRLTLVEVIGTEEAG